MGAGGEHYLSGRFICGGVSLTSKTYILTVWHLFFPISVSVFLIIECRVSLSEQNIVNICSDKDHHTTSHNNHLIQHYKKASIDPQFFVG